jgi:antitoxin component YwqK of YwqJK toxin-antitoxin module
MSKNGVERAFYSDGKPQSEVTWVDGKVNGITRHWYPNGVLASEMPVKDNLIHGVCRIWNEKGEQIDSYGVTLGNGPFRQWYPNGALKAEGRIMNGMPVGQMRCYDEGGNLVVQSFWLNQRQVSRKKYLEECEKNPDLPRPPADDSASKPTKKSGRF